MTEKMNIVDVSLNKIDRADQKFLYSCGNENETLIQSIKAVGILQPLQLQLKSDGKYRIIRGFRRFDAAVKLALPEVPATIVDSSENDFDLYVKSIHANTSQRNLNAMEQATIIDQLLQQFDVKEAEIITTYLPLLGLGANPKVLARYRGLIHLAPIIQKAVIDDFIGVELAARMNDLPPADMETFYTVCRQLKLGKNRQREFFNLLHDLSRMKKSSFEKLLQAINFDEIFTTDQLVSVKLERVRLGLRYLRFPRLTEVEEEFKRLSKELKLPAKIKLTPYPYFEEARYTLQFDFDSRKTLERRLADLQKMMTNPAFDALEKLT